MALKAPTIGGLPNPSTSTGTGGSGSTAQLNTGIPTSPMLGALGGGPHLNTGNQMGGPQVGTGQSTAVGPGTTPPPAPPTSGAPAQTGALGSTPPTGTTQPPAPTPPTPDPTAMMMGSAPSTTSPLSPVTSSSNLVGSQINLTPNAQTQQSGNQLSGLASAMSNPNVYQQAALGSFNTFAQQTDPAYQASIRAATAAAAANGGIGSGALSTSYGNLANQRNLQLEGMQQTAQQNALTGQAQYQLQQIGALQGVNAQQFGQGAAQTQQLDQQQQNQNQLQQQAIQNAMNQTTLEGQLQNQNFNQNLGLAEFGYSGNPAQTDASLASGYGAMGQNQANTLASNQQLQGINSALNGMTAAQQAAAQQQQYQAMLTGLGQGTNSGAAGISTMDPSTGLNINPQTGLMDTPQISAPPMPNMDPSTGLFIDPTTGLMQTPQMSGGF